MNSQTNDETIGYDKLRIQNFIVDRIGLQQFCNYLVNRIETDRGNRLAHIAFNALPQDALPNMVIFLVDTTEKAGYLADFIVHLCDFFLDSLGGNPRDLETAGLHDDLFRAARELQMENALPQLALHAFDRVGKGDQIRALLALTEACENGFFYDERLPWGADYPYRLFRRLGNSVSPDASKETIQEKLQELKKQPGGIPEDKRDILETLVKSPEERLMVDAFYYPALPSGKTVDCLNRYFYRHCQLPSNDEILDMFPGDAPMVFLLLGRPGDAVDTWKNRHDANPLDGETAHCLGLFYLAEALDTGASDDEKSREYFRYAIAHWAIALGNTAYWMKWGRERFQQYCADFVFTSINTLIDNTRIYLRDIAGQLPGDLKAETVRQLKTQLDIEFQAVRMTTAVGGIDLGDRGSSWFGPLWMDLYGVRPHLSRHIAAYDPGKAPEKLISGLIPPTESLIRLRWYFSSLATPAILFEGPEQNPMKTLEYLFNVPDIPDCHDSRCLRHGGSAFPVPLCSGGEHFVQLNPAYSDYADPVKLMGRDAVLLAITAHSLIILGLVRGKEHRDFDSLLDHCQEILNLGAYSENPVYVRMGFRHMVMTETKINASSCDMNRLNAAIKFADIVLNALGESYRALDSKVKAREETRDVPLKQRLAKLLCERGNRKSDADDIPGAEASLVRALEVAPHLHDARISLAMLWMNVAYQTFFTDPFLAQDYIRRATNLIDEGEKNCKGYDYSEIRTSLENVRQRYSNQQKESLARRSVSTAEVEAEEPAPDENEDPSPAWLLGQGVSKMRVGRPDIAVDFFEKALDKAPGDIDIEKEIPSALMEYGIKLTRDNRHKDAMNLVESWNDRLPSQKERVREQLQLLKWFPYVQSCLDYIGDFHYEIIDYREIRLFFWDPVNEADFQWVRVRVQDDYLAMSARLPLFSKSEFKTVLLNLLQVSDPIVFKVAYASGNEPVLRLFVPFHLLFDPGWFIRTAFDLSRFVVISGRLLSDADALGARFREVEAQAVQRHRDFPLRRSARALLSVCNQRGMTYDRLNDDHYTVDQGRVTMQSHANGTRIFTPLGKLPEDHATEPALRLMINKNTQFKQCKLSLDKESNIVLGVALPYLEESDAAAAFDKFEQYAAELKPRLFPQPV